MAHPSQTLPRSSSEHVRPWALDEFRKFTGSALGFAAFGASAFDEVAFPSVAAAVDRTGRFDANFTDRGIRSLTRAYLSLSTEAADRERYAEELKVAHREVRGRGKGDYKDIRYSALDPELWNWILMSGYMVFFKAFTPATGVVLSDAEKEAAYDYLISKFGGLRLKSAAHPFPEAYAEAVRYYDEVATTKLEPNPFLDRRVAGLSRLPLPTLLLPAPLRLALTPVWLLVRPIVGHVIKICSFGIMHPEVLKATRFVWKPRHSLQFRLFTKVIQTAWRRLPDPIVLEPIAYNRLRHERLTDPGERAASQRRYERLVAFYGSLQLDSFAPDGAAAAGCPF